MKQKIEIMKRTTLTDAEIEGFMDFEALVAKAQTKPGLSNWPLYTGMVLLAGIIGFGIWFKNQGDTETITTSDNLLKQNIPEQQPQSMLPDNKIDSVAATIEPKAETSIIKKPVPIKKSVEPETKIKAGYQQAEPVGGYEKLYQSLNEAIHYPEAAVRDSVQGVVVVDFVVNKSGKPEQIRIQQSLREDCDKEAIRVIENMEPWLPALLNGKPVPARVSVPLTFQLIQTY